MRRIVTQRIERKYEDSRAPNPKDKIWLNATVEPILTSEKRIENMAVKIIAAGISDLSLSHYKGLTIERNFIL